MFSASTMSSNLVCLSCQPALTQAKDLLNQGKYQAALHCLQATEQSLQEPENFVLQAVCFILLNQPRAALQVCDRALALEAHHAQAWLFRGVALHRLGRFQESYQCYNRALGHPPRSAQVWVTSLRARLRAGKLRLRRSLHHRLDQWVH
jgi:tetratricopeptide (TPR) repeat protein